MIKNIHSPKNKLAVLTVGMGAVSTSFFAGVEAILRKGAMPIGSFSQMGKLGGKPLAQVVPLAALKNLVFGGWDIQPINAYQAAVKAAVLEKSLLDQLAPYLKTISPMKGVFDKKFAPSLKGSHTKNKSSKLALADSVRADIVSFMKKNKCSRAVMLFLASTEAYQPVSELHRSLAAFEQGLRKNDPRISPAMIYAYAAIKEGVPFANGAPGEWQDAPFIQELADQNGVPLAGCDLKTGQTYLKAVIAAGLMKRLLGVHGWYSTNILGNEDGRVLNHPASFRAKEISKSRVLDSILSAREYPDLYKNVVHKVAINYYPPRGDNKEGWDNVDIFGWLGYPMQIKINFLCRDSILAAPLVLDLALFLDLAKRAGQRGAQDWLSFYFKSPLAQPGRSISHDPSVQHGELQKALHRNLVLLKKNKA